MEDNYINNIVIFFFFAICQHELYIGIHALEKEMATHSSVLAWRTPGTGGLPSLGSHRVGHDWRDLAAAAAAYRCPLHPEPHFPPLYLLYPSGLSWNTGFGYAALCIELVLVICFTYGNVHVSALFSQIIPPLPSPTASKNLFFFLKIMYLF